MYTKEKNHAELRSHGFQQIEIKTRYPLRNNRKTRYEMDLFISTPYQLGIDEHRYGRQGFYRDMKDNTRYTINEIPLHQLSEKQSEQISPVARIYQVLKEKKTLTSEEEHMVLYELRSLSNYFSTQVKQSYRRDKRLVRQKNDENAEAEGRITQQLQEIQKFLHTYRELMKEIDSCTKSLDVHKASLWADEYMSLTTERILLYYYNLLKHTPPSEKLLKDISRTVQQEKKWRTEKQYISACIDGDQISREAGLERENMLKKWSQGVLYLTSQDSKVEKGLIHVFAGAAAAIAMAVAVLFTFFADTWFSIYSLPWALVIIVSYILKDRIKEGFRGLFIRILPRLISDKTENLIDQRKKEVVGKARSFVKFIKRKNLPEQMKTAMGRQEDELGKTLEESNIIWLNKTILLRSGKLLREQSRFNSITEIIRISLEDFFEHMDNPKKSICRADRQGNLVTISGNRVYHCDIFVKLADDSEKKERIFWYDVVLTQKGLLRIEQKDKNYGGTA